MTITVAGVGLIADEFEAAPAQCQRALVRSLNRGTVAGRTFLVSTVAKDIGIRNASVAKAIITRNASLNNPTAQIAAGLKRIPVIDMNARDLAAGKRRKRFGGVVYSAGGGAQARIPKAFIRRMRSGHVGVFVREGRERKSRGAWSKNLPIEEKAGPSIGRVVAKFEAPAVARAYEVFRNTLDREIDFRKARAAGTV